MFTARLSGFVVSYTTEIQDKSKKINESSYLQLK